MQSMTISRSTWEGSWVSTSGKTADSSSMTTRLTKTTKTSPSSVALTSSPQYYGNTTLSPIPEQLTGVEALEILTFANWICAFGVFSNALALTILYRSPKDAKRSVPFIRLIEFLVGCDYISHVLICPTVIATRGSLVRAGGMALCNLQAFFFMFFLNAEASVVLLMSVERFAATKYPFQYRTYVATSTRRLTLLIASSWATSGFLAALPLMGVGRYAERWPGTWCFVDERDNSIGSYIFVTVFALLGLLITATIFVLNVVVIHHLWRMRRIRNINDKSKTSLSRKSSFIDRAAALQQEMNAMCFLFIILVIFTACYTPLMVRLLTRKYWHVEDVERGGWEDQLDRRMIRIASLNQVLDPWVYIITRHVSCKRFVRCRGAFSMSTPMGRPTDASSTTSRIQDRLRPREGPHLARKQSHSITSTASITPGGLRGSGKRVTLAESTPSQHSTNVPEQ